MKNPGKIIKRKKEKRGAFPFLIQLSSYPHKIPSAKANCCINPSQEAAIRKGEEGVEVSSVRQEQPRKWCGGGGEGESGM